MPRNVIGKPPFPPILLFEVDRNLSLGDLLRIATDRPKGASICIRYPEGPAQRGGYFFHFIPTSRRNTEFDVLDFEKKPVKRFTARALVSFINHCTGKVFDEPSFTLCQTELNFLKDEEPSA